MSLSASIKTVYPFLAELGIQDVNPGCYDGEKWSAGGEIVDSISPINGKPIGPKIQLATAEDTTRCINNIVKARKAWVKITGPKRGDIVRQIGDELRKYLTPLGNLLATEVGKIAAEGKGEVQEFVDVCDFATGLSRQLPGQVFPSERPGHFFMEQWHPLGSIGVIAAFNFPVAVPGWNTAISLICGNTQVWKCAPTACLTSIATQKIICNVLERNNLPPIACFVCGGKDIGEIIVESKQLPLISFTGSSAAGNIVNQRVAARFGKCILELGGNNAIVILEDADIEIALRSTVFGAVGTCGQRCTTCRRVYLQEKVYDSFVKRLADIYSRLKIGSPLEDGVLVGPLHTLVGVDAFEKGVARAIKEGGKVLAGGKAFHDSKEVPGPNYVQPTIIAIDPNAECVKEECFTPILYVMKIKDLEEGIEYNNNVEHGLSSACFTNDLRLQNVWTGPLGSDCGLANVNIPTNGAEIGGAFGGEKATGGGRESGSDAWKQYCRRQTNTINYSSALPLAQGINFDPK